MDLLARRLFDANRIRPLGICRDRYGTITVDAVE